ncbi:MAG: SPOR domain-containing protein [Saprospiraceae bacterium]|nr:SPOR domain-containing protein [Saprospiraceae bacterium]
MRYILIFFVLLFSTSYSGNCQDQSYYTINLGTFVNAKSDDFQGLKGLGFVHADQMDQNLFQIYIGGFSNQSAADDMLRRVRNAGYTGAYTQAFSSYNGKPMVVIQLATLDARKDIDWSRYMDAGPLSVQLDGNTIKMLTGPYADVSNARNAVRVIQQKGFKGAFIRRVNSIFLHKVGTFETGVQMAKRPLIPLQVTEEPKAQSSQPTPASYGLDPTQAAGQNMGVRGNTGGASAMLTVKAPAKEIPTVELPYIRPKIKRRSALDLQIALKKEGVYTGSLDGMYGPVTKTAYEKAREKNPQLKKYQLLGEQGLWNTSDVEESILQNAIDQLPESSSALSVLERYDDPIAKGYRAYWLFKSSGPSPEVNTLMNQALTTAFKQVNFLGMPSFDPNATYAYQRLDQLIQHVYYLHAVPKSPYAAPCWLPNTHPNEAAQAQASFSQSGSALRPRVRDCDVISKWPSVQTLLAIASDLNADPMMDASKWGQANALRAQLFLSKDAVSPDMVKVVTAWSNRLWKGLNAWAKQDPLHDRLVSAMKLSYFQTQVLLEDYYINMGFKEQEAKDKSLVTMRTLVGYQLERFTRL